MTEKIEVKIHIEANIADKEKIEQLQISLQQDLRHEMYIESVIPVQPSNTPENTKSIGLESLGEWMVKVGTSAIPELIKFIAQRNAQRQNSSYPKILVKIKRGSVELEYDPTRIKIEELPQFIEKIKKALSS